MKQWNFISVFILIFFVSGCREQKPFPPADRAYAMEILQRQCRIIPRYSGTPGAKQTAELILKEASKIKPVNGKNLRCSIVEFQENTSTGPMVFRNVRVVVPGKSEKKPVILGAHYDAKKLDLTPDFQAANDGGSGVAVLFAVMKALSEREEPLPFSVHFLFFDGEECQLDYGPTDGLHGSKRAAKDYTSEPSVSEIGKPRTMILADMVGDQDWKISLPQNSTEFLKQTVLKSAEKLHLSDSVFRGDLTILDDHVPFLDAGIPAIDLIDFEYGPDNIYWHTAADTMDKIDPESLGKTADLILQILLSL